MTVTTVTSVTQTVEYILRVQMQEPPDRTDIPEENRIGDAMFDWTAEIEGMAEEWELISRTILPGPGAPSRVRCAARRLDPTRHYATSRRWTVISPEGQTVTVCSAACAVSWFCEQVPADILEGKRGTLTKGGTAA